MCFLTIRLQPTEAVPVTGSGVRNGTLSGGSRGQEKGRLSHRGGGRRETSSGTPPSGQTRVGEGPGHWKSAGSALRVEWTERKRPRGRESKAHARV